MNEAILLFFTLLVPIVIIQELLKTKQKKYKKNISYSKKKPKQEKEAIAIKIQNSTITKDKNIEKDKEYIINFLIKHSKEQIKKEELEPLSITYLNALYRKTLLELNKPKEYKKDTNQKDTNQNEEKGRLYEQYVGKYFEKKGYIVIYNGIEKGKKDNGIDLIAIKENEALLIQCKNWKANSKYKISHRDIKAFIGDTTIFLQKKPQYKNYNIKRLFVVSNKILDSSAIKYIKENQNTIRYLYLPFPLDS